MPDPDRWPMSQEMLDKHFFGRSSFNSRPDRYFATVEYNYGKASGTEDFCRKAQLLNIEANKAMYEGWQHHMWNDATGVLTWMSQSAYPSFVWQTYDYYYDLNGAYWGVRKACEPVHVQWSYADNTVKAVNATLRGYEGGARHGDGLRHGGARSEALFARGDPHGASEQRRGGAAASSAG